MSYFSLHVSTVRRSKGQNAIECAAYNSRSKLSLFVTDKGTGIETKLTWDYRNKPGLVYSKIHAPEGSPDWVYDRTSLWNKAELAETRRNSRTSQKIMLSLPNEFSVEQNIPLVEELVSELVSMGMVVDANIHNDNPDNPHVHLMMTMRDLVLNRYGEMEFSRVKNRDWTKPSFVEFVRELACDLINKHYQMHGFDIRVTHESYKKLGIDLIPSVHEGPAHYMDSSELKELNLAIAAENAKKIIEKPSIILDLLALNHPVFTKEQIAIELDKRLYASIDFSKIDDVEELNRELSAIFIVTYQKILNCPEITQVVEEDLKGRTLYTTTKRLELEERFICTVENMSKNNSHALNLDQNALDHLSLREKVTETIRDIATNVADYIEDRVGLKIDVPKAPPALSKEQRLAVINVLNGSNISVLEGIPGAGKTTAMREIFRQYKKAGKKVIGTAPSSSASLELAKATSIECKNGSLWRKTWMEEVGKEFELCLHGDYYKEDQYKHKDTIFGFSSSSLTKNHVMIIDESSMVEMANMDYFLTQAKAVGAKVIVVGDSNQLSPVGWAGAFGKIISICGSEKLEESRRQINPLHQEATKLLGQYKVRAALDIFWDDGNILVSKSKVDAISKCVQEFVTNYIQEAKKLNADDLVSIKSHVIGVFENKTRNRLNEAVRTQLKEAGVLKGTEYNIWVGSKNGEKKIISLTRGEQIVFARNANRLGTNGIFNGEVGTVLKVRKASKHKASGQNLAVIDMLVHRANGKKEKVSLNLHELARSRYFEDGVSIEYGYALTAHKLQGASIDYVSVLLEKGIGFEVFNVLATRHREKVLFYINKRLLESVFYEALDETSDKAKNRFEIHYKDEEIEKGGLAKLVSKRTNTSFASDYFSMGKTPEDEIIKKYLDKSEETISVIRKITSWQTKIFRITGIKPQMWEHELWDEFKKARDARADKALTIKMDYPRFKERLMQLGMNFATIEKHASQIFKRDSQLDKFQVEQKITILHEQDIFKELVDAVSIGDTQEIYKKLIGVNLYIANNLVLIEERQSDIEATYEKRHELLDKIEIEENFRKKLTPEYLGRIYKVNTKISNTKDQNIHQDSGVLALERYQALVQEHGIDQALRMVERKPTILGDLKGMGLGKFFAFNNARLDATYLLENIGKQLMAYNRSGAMVKKYNEEFEKENFEAKLFELAKEVEHLRSLLPADIDKEFLEQVEAKFGTSGAGSKASNIDWVDLQQSELFEVVKIGNIAKEIVSPTNEESKDEVKKEKLSRTDIALKKDSTFEHGIAKNDKIEKFKEQTKAFINDPGKVNNQVAVRDIDEKVATKKETFKEEQSVEKQITKKVNSQTKQSTKQISAKPTLDNIKNENKYEAASKTNDEVKKEEVAGTDIALKKDSTFEHGIAKNDKIERFKEQTKTSINDSGKVNDQAIVRDIDEKGVAKKEQAKEDKSVEKQITKKVNSQTKQSIKQDLPKPTFKLSFNEVKMALTQSIVSEIFRKYAQLINTDGKIEKHSDHISCGSLNMNINKKLGLWYRFSDGSSGDIFSFIQEATGCSKFEALEIVASHAGIVPTTQVNYYKANNIKIEQNTNNEPLKAKDEWIAIDITKNNNIPAFNASKDLARVLKEKNWKLSNTYEYRNKDGELIGFVIRALDQEGKKQPRPVAYCHNPAKNKSYWMLKGFTDNGYKPIYGIEKLGQYSTKKVMIVEGEKSVDGACKLFPEYIVISWMGGSQSTAKVNWKHLEGREVIIWPDNDETGIKAANNIKEHIDNHNGFTGLVSIIDTKKLGLPEKWDLADSLPDHISKEQLNKIVNTTNKQEIRNKNEPQVEVNKEDKKLIINSLQLLIATGRADKDEYVSKEMYHETLLLIAKNKGLKLTELNKDNFAKEIGSLQDDYCNLQRNLQVNDRNNQLNTNHGNNKKDQIFSELVQDTLILHQLQFGVKQLTQTHREHIEQTARNEIAKMKRFTDSDKEFLGSNMYKAVTNSKWLEELENKNLEKSSFAKLRSTAKSIDEFLDGNIHPNNKVDILASYKNLSYLRKYGIEETAIIDSFKTNHDKGIEHLADMSTKLKEAVNYLEHNNDAKEMLQEVTNLGFKANDENIQKQLVKDLTGKSQEVMEHHLYKIRDEYYVKTKVGEIAQEKTQAVTPKQLLEVLTKEQKFFKELGKNLKFKTNDEILLKTMEQADRNEKNNCLEQLHKIVGLHVDKGISRPEEVTKILKTCEGVHGIEGTCKTLINSYQIHAAKEIQKCLQGIYDGKNVSMGGKKFDCQMEFLEYVLESQKHNEFLPRQNIQNAHAKLVQHHLSNDYAMEM